MAVPSSPAPPLTVLAHELSVTGPLLRAARTDYGAPDHAVAFDVAFDRAKNVRDYMEDRALFVDRAFRRILGDMSPAAFAAVVDGHGGAAVAEWVRNSLHGAVEAALHSQVQDAIARNLPGAAIVNGLPAPTTPCSVTSALRTAFELLELNLRNDPTLQVHAMNQGAVAACVVLSAPPERQPNLLYTAHLGDVRIVLSERGVAQVLTQDHTARVHSEAAAVVARGGVVRADASAPAVPRVWQPSAMGALTGGLIPTRSLGDFCCKPAVSAEPDLRKVNLSPSSEFLIIASDGLWDALEAQESVDLVRDFLMTFADTELDDIAGAVGRRSVARFLRHRAIRKGSTDNITVMVILLQDPANMLRQAPPSSEM